MAHEHHHEEEEEHSLKGRLLLLGATVVLLCIAYYIENHLDLPMWQVLLIYLVPYLMVGYDTICEAIEGLMHGEALNEDFLMTLATIGALGIGFMPGAESEFPEAVFVMLFFQVGEMFEDYAEGRSRESISHLMDIRPDTANLLVNEEVQVVSPDQVEVGSVILVKPGEKVPLDGVILKGESSLNTVALTGESVPRQVAEGDEILSGCVNMNGVLQVRTTKSFGESTVSKIIDLVENASENKSRSESFITRFAKIYTPIVVGVAVLLAVLPPLISGDFVGNFADWLRRALIFLVVSCPCALVISVPLAFFGGIGGASRQGILIKGSNFMDTLAKVKTVVFDKTGTLTHGVFAVDVVHPDQCDANHLLHLAAHVERFSTHPIAQALREAYPDENDDCQISQVEEIAGQGIRAKVNEHVVCVGNLKMMQTLFREEEIHADCCAHAIGTIVHVAIDGQYAGHVVISDQVKEDSAEGIRRLKELGVRKTVMLTGDRKEVGDHVANQLGLDEWYTELLPADKVSHVETLLKEGSPLAFVGDGINDAPVLARADIGFAMGGLGSDAAIEAADVVLMEDQPSKIATAIQISRRTIRIATENIEFALGVKLLVLVLATVGMANMWMAVFADVGVTVIAVLNSMRALKS